ncbi:MAG: helix-turn-helix transcriptional regulator [Prevotella sp.]|nr:helix-turn-helix transcriptional regulator [Prevotella sp.]
MIVSSWSSGISTVVSNARRLVPDVVWMGESLWINHSNHSNRASLIQDWLPTLNFAGKQTTMDKMYITIDGLPTVAYFADKACLSPNYFGDLISKESGTTAQRHIQDAVIERSKQLLIETRLPVSEIAYQLGFEYPQHFSRLFKSRTGMTPNAYRLTA